MEVPSSLMMFIDSARLFLKNEVRMQVKEEIVKYMICNNFEPFSAAYSRYRISADPSARLKIKEVIDLSEAQYNAALEDALNPAIPV